MLTDDPRGENRTPTPSEPVAQGEILQPEDFTVIRIDGKPDRFVTVQAFGHSFRDIDAETAADLITLEKEGAIYSKFWDEAAQSFRHFRIPLLPGEIFAYVEAELAQQEYRDAVRDNPDGSIEEHMAALANHDIADRVLSYPMEELHDGRWFDNRGCPASFYGPELEALVCGIRKERYEPLPKLGTPRDQFAQLEQALTSLPVGIRVLQDRSHGRPDFAVENEYDLQDLAFVVVRSLFGDARREEWTPQIAGRGRRMDLVVPSIETVIELKRVRDARHASTVAEELMVDFETYHTHPACRMLLAVVHDPAQHLPDPREWARQLSGARVKDGHMFEVSVRVI